MKTCSKCDEERPLEDFPKNGKDRRGAQRYRSSCLECERGPNRRREIASMEESTEKMCPFCQKGFEPKEPVKRYRRNKLTVPYHQACHEKYEDLIAGFERD
ncbi:hypothetical protein [Streptomyces sp. B1I3]|uniref:hypothetical protein n=1 Tax=Streptomyces sp. B1I3 TaxID=3042264 RepID=UPI0027865714|nr:hypothetical protein [Streptomyces sp. B1I3]MDQ0793581.1 hypothetical protein [Streptomyces sp. B1I3]